MIKLEDRVCPYLCGLGFWLDTFVNSLPNRSTLTLNFTTDLPGFTFRRVEVAGTRFYLQLIMVLGPRKPGTSACGDHTDTRAIRAV